MKRYRIAKILILIPIVIFVITALCMGLATILEFPTDRGVVYSIFAGIGILSMFLSPLPCLVISIVGTVFAAKATKEGIIQSRKFFIIGIIEIVAYIVGVILAATMFYYGQSV